MTNNNLPPELGAIVERAMKRLTDEAFEPTCLKEYEDNYRHIIASAVQEAAEWGKKNADLLVEEE